MSGIRIDHVLPVSMHQALNALADRDFLAECLPGDWTRDAAPDDVLRGTCGMEISGARTAFHLGARLIDIDFDEGALRYEVGAQEVDGRARVAMTLDMKLTAQGVAETAVSLRPRLTTAGLDDPEAAAGLEHAIASALTDFGARSATRLARDGGSAWVAPGLRPPTTDGPVPAVPGGRVDGRGKTFLRVALPLGGAVAGFITWNLIRSVRKNARVSGKGQ